MEEKVFVLFYGDWEEVSQEELKLLDLAMYRKVKLYNDDLTLKGIGYYPYFNKYGY